MLRAASMGPRLFSRGRFLSLDPMSAGRGPASMGPRLFSRGRKAMAVAKEVTGTMLQWGRGCSAAEGAAGLSATSIEAIASMGPRLFSRGRCRSGAPRC